MSPNQFLSLAETDEEQSVDFRSLYEECAPRLRELIGRILGASHDPDDVHDVLQTVWVCVWLKRRHLRPGTARAWLRCVAIRIACRWRRQAWFRQRVPLGPDLVDAFPDWHTPAQELEARERDEAINAVLLRMSEKQRAVLELAAREGLSPREIAKRLGTTSATVRARLFRANLKLRKQLDAARGENTSYACGPRKSR